ncbi:MAG: cyclic nucleotide-binding domain-containing protein [Deltaproteobacteria bacterium]|nr:cyclic nucleotide-binding domain-containing protein [Deltaproteobacteria bacterium]MCL5276876.1 cyclic nucleotide-binding domain-containing protein [Deltaproteobacteria bacterium]
MNTVRILKEAALFKGLEERIINILANIAETVDVPAETVIFAEGMPSDAMYVIASGSVEVVKDAAEGREAVIGELKAGDVIGVLALFNGGDGEEKRAVTVRSREPVMLVAITRDSFNKLVNNNIHAAYQVLLNAARYFIHTFNDPGSSKEVIQ